MWINNPDIVHKQLLFYFNWNNWFECNTVSTDTKTYKGGCGHVRFDYRPTHMPIYEKNKNSLYLLAFLNKLLGRVHGESKDTGHFVSQKTQ